jgi:hypothetical protein
MAVHVRNQEFLSNWMLVEPAFARLVTSSWVALTVIGNATHDDTRGLWLGGIGIPGDICGLGIAGDIKDGSRRQASVPIEKNDTDLPVMAVGAGAMALR